MKKVVAHIILIISLVLPPVPISADEGSASPSEPSLSEEKEDRAPETEEVGYETTEQPKDSGSDPEGYSTETEATENRETETLPGKEEDGTNGTSDSDAANEDPSGGGKSVTTDDAPRDETTPGKPLSPATAEAEETDASEREEPVPAPADTNGSDGKTGDSEPIRTETTPATADTDTGDVVSPDIVLSEIQVAGDDANDEFIELYNPDSESVSLSGLRLCRRTSGTGISQIKAFSSGDAIPGEKRYLFAHTDGAFADIADTTTKSSPLAPNNAIALISGIACDDSNAIILDSVAWGNGTAFDDNAPRIGNPPSGSALVRDIDDNAWSIVAEPTPTNSHEETVENGTDDEEDFGEDPVPDLPSPGTVILSEIFPNPIDEADEWVELFNGSDEEIPLAGWILADAVKEYAFPDGTRIGGNGFLVIPRSESGLALNNGSETVTLLMPNNTASDSYEYPKTVEESSWARNETGNFELTDIPTPGEANLFPIIEEPYLAPLPPDGGIRINEVYPNPETKGEADEWIELVNISDADISLAAFILRDASKNGKYVFGDTVAIGAGNFLVLPRSETKISLNNSAETLRLLWHDDETVIASLSYSRTVEGASYGYYRDDRYRFSEKVTPGAENRFGKEPKIEDSDIPKKGYRDVPVAFSAEGNEKDMRYVWDFGDEHKSYKRETTHRYEKTGAYHGSLTIRGEIEEVVKTFTIRIEKHPRYDLRITALFPNPDGRDTDFEWIRIENREKKSVDLTGWIIASGTTEERLVNHKILTEDLRIGAGESFMLTRADSRFTLPNKQAVIELRRPDGSRADRVAYDRPDGIDEEELLMVGDGGTLVWISPEPATDTSADVSEDIAENPFLSGMTAHPARFTFSRFLALGTPFRITLPDSAPQVLGITDAQATTDAGDRDLWLDAAFRTLNDILLSVFGG